MHYPLYVIPLHPVNPKHHNARQQLLDRWISLGSKGKLLLFRWGSVGRIARGVRGVGRGAWGVGIRV